MGLISYCDITQRSISLFLKICINTQLLAQQYSIVEQLPIQKTSSFSLLMLIKKDTNTLHNQSSIFALRDENIDGDDNPGFVNTGIASFAPDSSEQDVLAEFSN